MSDRFIPLSVPNFKGNEKKYVNDAVVSEWVSSGGSKVVDFENAVAKYVDVKNAVACASGTAGLHLAMLCAGVSEHEVIAPNLTFIAAINPIKYVNSQPVFVGCDDSLCIDPDAVQSFCENECSMKDGKLFNRTSGKMVAALLVVHVFGNLANMQRLCEIAKKYALVLIEDATEALGSYYTKGVFAGKHAGTIGDVGVYSFNGNKLITTGSGGMLVTNNNEIAQKARHLSTQAKTDQVQFYHDEVGYNYRMTNLQAALGLAQIEQIETFIKRKKEVYEMYFKALNNKKGLKILPFCEGTRPNRWFFSLLLSEEYPCKRDELISRLQEKSIQTRPIWALINEQPPYAKNQAFKTNKSEFYRENIVNLPCSTNIQDEDVERVIEAVLSF